MSTKLVPISKEQLEYFYHEKRLSTVDIARQFNVTKATIRRKMVRFGIERRHISEAARQRRVNHPIKGEMLHNWQGGKILHEGYWFVLIDGKYQAEHRVIVEQHLERKLSKSEIVHHKNGNRKDNRLENLELLSISEHIKHHKQGVKRDKGRFVKEDVDYAPAKGNQKKEAIKDSALRTIGSR